jgi:hypothetical protein
MATLLQKMMLIGNGTQFDFVRVGKLNRLSIPLEYRI